ncbi:MAG: carbohydrate ABC transporter permease [Candidatus Choladocola sp.]|nr:carbohydrate ABC transporter permease [Candidatus Choladocola sp.]
MRGEKIRKGILYIILTFFALIVMMPIIMLFLSAIRNTSEFYSKLNLLSIPENICWENFSKAWLNGKLFLYMKNGAIVTLIKVPLGILIASMCAYAITRLDIPFANGLFVIILAGMMLPRQMTLIPLNILYSRLKLNNTYFCLILTYLGFGVSLGTLVFRGFFRSIPKELDESARIDGAGKYQIYARIIMPIAKPAISTMVILDFLSTWNEFMVQSVLITKDTMKTVPFGLLTFIGEYSTDYGLLSAGVLISIIPVFIVYLIFQKNFIQGMAGAVKG